MPSILLSGPAGAGKSQEARRLLEANPGPAVVADFQSLVAAILQHERGPDGKYPMRPEWVLPLAESLRLELIDRARAAEVDVITTNSDGDRGRRQRLLDRLGPGASERIIDPGQAVVTARLADAATGVVSPQCEQAVGRWFSRLR